MQNLGGWLTRIELQPLFAPNTATAIRSVLASDSQSAHGGNNTMAQTHPSRLARCEQFAPLLLFPSDSSTNRREKWNSNEWSTEALLKDGRTVAGLPPLSSRKKPLSPRMSCVYFMDCVKLVGLSASAQILTFSRCSFTGWKHNIKCLQLSLL